MGTNIIHFDGTRFPLVLTSCDVYSMARSSDSPLCSTVNTSQPAPGAVSDRDVLLLDHVWRSVSLPSNVKFISRIPVYFWNKSFLCYFLFKKTSVNSHTRSTFPYLAAYFHTWLRYHNHSKWAPKCSIWFLHAKWHHMDFKDKKQHLNICSDTQ